MDIDWQKISDTVMHFVTTYGLRLVMGIIVLLIGLMIIKRVVRFSDKRMEARNVDSSLRPFLRSLIGALLKVMLFISVLSMIGIAMTSFIAVLGAAGLAIGLALQGSLANFAGGVLILLLKPFKIGDFIEGNGQSGTVREIQIFYTYVTSPSGQEIVIPNGQLSNNTVKNYSWHPTRRLDMTFGIGYGDDIDKAKQVISNLATAEDRFLEELGITLFVEGLADSSVNIRLRAWANNDDYWDIYNNFNEKVKKAFDKEGINIPFPQMDVHVHNS